MSQPLGREPNPQEALVLRRLADGRWRSTRALGGNLALPRLHRLARHGAIVARPRPSLHGLQWRRPDQEAAT